MLLHELAGGMGGCSQLVETLVGSMQMHDKLLSRGYLQMLEACVPRWW